MFSLFKKSKKVDTKNEKPEEEKSPQSGLFSFGGSVAYKKQAQTKTNKVSSAN